MSSEIFKPCPIVVIVTPENALYSKAGWVIRSTPPLWGDSEG